MSSPWPSAGRTATGKVRQRNEDAILARDDVGLWVVADGAGGHASGDQASGLIVERLAALPRTGSTVDFVEAIEDSLLDVNTELLDRARSRGVDLIASTVVVLVKDPAVTLCGWAGDSRGYRYHAGKLRQITRDHVVVPDGALTRAVGAEPSLFLDWVVMANEPGSTLLMCSDGINKEMSDAEIESACRHESADATLEELFDTTLARAARDNLSAVVLRLDDGVGRPGDEAANDELIERLNRELGALDEAHYLRRIGRASYRTRRRQLLGDLGGGKGAAVPGATSEPTVRRHGIGGAGGDALARLFPRRARWLDWRRWFRRR